MRVPDQQQTARHLEDLKTLGLIICKYGHSQIEQRTSELSEGHLGIDRLSFRWCSAGLAAARAEGRIGGRRKKLDLSTRPEIAESVVSGCIRC